MANTINVTGLSRASQTYNPVLQMLPFMVLEAVTKQLGINIMEVDGKDTIIQFQRKGGNSKPYASTTSLANLYASEIGKAVERDLEVKKCVLILKEDINNYADKKVISNAAEKVNNQTKKHPLERLILETIVKTLSEDLIMAIFPGERDTTNLSPLGMFDGVDTIIDADISAGAISTALGNYIELGASPFAAPSDANDTDAYDNLVIFLRSLNPALRKQGVLYLPDNVMFNAMDALGNKLKYKNVMEFDQFLQHLKGTAQAPSLSIVSHEAIGTGDRIMCQLRGNMDLGMNTKSDTQFIQVRDPFEDPNLVQFWSQWDAGFRIRSLHQKTFAVSDGTPVADSTLSGDYQS